MNVQSNMNAYTNSKQNTSFGMVKVQCGLKNSPSLKLVDEFNEAGKYAKGYVFNNGQGRIFKGTFYEIFKTLFGSTEERELLKTFKADNIIAKSITTKEGESLIAQHKEFENKFEKYINI